jgi:ATP-dependent RNA helicase DDX24/MAK5
VISPEATPTSKPEVNNSTCTCQIANEYKNIGLKRKGTTKPALPREKAKFQHCSADDLPWKSVSRSFEAGIGFDDGILDFEEVEGVEVIYETTDASGGRTVKFNVSFISI